MRHNKMIEWNQLLKSVKPWLSRHWPLWMSGVQVKAWRDRQVWVHMPIASEVAVGHLALGANVSLRLLLTRLSEEFPFRFQVRNLKVETHHVVDQSVDFKFELPLSEWERIRLKLSREHQTEEQLIFSAHLADGRLAATLTFDLAFQLEKFLSA